MQDIIAMNELEEGKKHEGGGLLPLMVLHSFVSTVNTVFE